MPAWRNWQTRWTQNPVPARACRFDPGRRYHTKNKPRKMISIFQGLFFVREFQDGLAILLTLSIFRLSFLIVVHSSTALLIHYYGETVQSSSYINHNRQGFFFTSFGCASEIKNTLIEQHFKVFSENLWIIQVLYIVPIKWYNRHKIYMGSESINESRNHRNKNYLL